MLYMKNILISIIRLYRRYISPLTPPACRFSPTCSQYALDALERYGALRGLRLALLRLCRCHPFHRANYKVYDPVP